MRFLAAIFLATLPFSAFASPPIAPDHALTPGVADPAVTQANIARTICVSGYTAEVRSVGARTKREVFASYGVDPKVGGPYEIDHLISLELGGANDARNLWPESYATKPWNAHIKDHLENKLHALVCSGTITLKAAQHAIATDWRRAFKEFVEK